MRKPSPKQIILPFCACLLLAGQQAAGQTPAPAIHTPFQLPLADKTTATATILPAPQSRAYLVYATPAGKLGLWLMMKATDPIPPDPIPPPPPEPVKLFIAIIEDPERTSQAQRDVLADQGWRNLAGPPHQFLGILPVDLIDKRTGLPPPHLAPYLSHAKTKPLPWVIFTDENRNILFEGPLPPTAPDLERLIRTHGG